MNRLLKNYRFPEHIEVLFMLTLGILLQMTDGTPFTIKERWKIVWETELPPENFSPFVENCIKTVLSVIIAVRCVSTFIYVVSAKLVIFCILKDSAPQVMLLWLLVSMIKSVLLTFVETLTGVYVCSAFGKIRKACLEFFVSKSLEIKFSLTSKLTHELKKFQNSLMREYFSKIVFAVYMWACVLSIYQDILRRAEGNEKDPLLEQLFKQKMEFRSHRARSLLDESTLYKTACLNSFEFRDVPQIILQMLKKEEELSQDSLLGPGMMLASVSNLGSFDNLKTSQSLGELGMVDMKFVHVEDMDEDEAFSPQDKALKFLKMTWSDVRKARENRRDIEADVYTVDDDTWNRVSTVEARIHVPKHARAEVFMREIPQVDLNDARGLDRERQRKKYLELKFGLSNFNYYQEKEVESEDEQSEEDEVFALSSQRLSDSNTPPLFMSNIREEVSVNRIRLDFIPRSLKSNNCESLFKENFMSVIGPEVFDRAPKLPMLSSSPKATSRPGVRSSTSLPAFSEGNNKMEKAISFGDAAAEKGEHQASAPQESRSELLQAKERIEGSSHEFLARSQPEKMKDTVKSPSKKDIFGSYKSSKKLGQEESENGESVVPSSAEQENEFKPATEKKSVEAAGKSFSSFRKKQTKTKKPKTEKNEQNSFEALEVDSETILAGKEEESTARKEDNQEQESSSKFQVRSLGKRRSSGKLEDLSFSSTNNKQMYFLTELLQKPLTDVLWSYYDLKSKVHVRRPTVDLLQRQSCLLGDHSFKKHDRIWKSKVLKTATFYQNPVPPSSREVDWREWLINQYYCLMAKRMGRNNLGVESPELEKFQIAMTLGVKDSKTTDLAGSWPEEGPYAPKYSRIRNTLEDEPNIKKSKPPTKLPTDLDNQETKTNETTKDRTNGKYINPKAKSEKKPDEKNFASPEILYYVPEEYLPRSKESDESFSLYYSKAANLASPLLDTKRFIYPDHIHYSYKHVNKKGFDVDITGDLPLLFTMNTARDVKNISTRTDPEFVITRRPMDLSFATTNAFAEWQNNEINEAECTASDASQQPRSCLKKNHSDDHSYVDLEMSKEKKMKKTKRSKKVKDSNEGKNPSGKKIPQRPKLNSCDGNFRKIKHAYSAEDYLLIEKLLRLHLQQSNRENTSFGGLDKQRAPVQISSTQLHSNKGRINSMYNPAVFLNENKTRSERRKMDTQEERTKDMFARLKREALLQSNNFIKTFESSRRK